MKQTCTQVDQSGNHRSHRDLVIQSSALFGFFFNPKNVPPVISPDSKGDKAFTALHSPDGEKCEDAEECGEEFRFSRSIRFSIWHVRGHVHDGHSFLLPGGTCWAPAPIRRWARRSWPASATWPAPTARPAWCWSPARRPRPPTIATRTSSSACARRIDKGGGMLYNASTGTVESQYLVVNFLNVPYCAVKFLLMTNFLCAYKK